MREKSPGTQCVVPLVLTKNIAATTAALTKKTMLRKRKVQVSVCCACFTPLLFLTQERNSRWEIRFLKVISPEQGDESPTSTSSLTSTTWGYNKINFSNDNKFTWSHVMVLLISVYFISRFKKERPDFEENHILWKLPLNNSRRWTHPSGLYRASFGEAFQSYRTIHPWQDHSIQLPCFLDPYGCYKRL